jgi:hypothetical protein
LLFCVVERREPWDPCEDADPERRDGFAEPPEWLRVEERSL